MKNIISILFIVCFFSSSYARTPDIVAAVNNHPITAYELGERKKMIMAINNIDELNPQIEQKLLKAALKSLIEEEILFEHARSIKKQISEKEIKEAIASIEDKNKAPRGYLIQFLASKNVDINSFESQIKSELIKMNILSQFSRDVAISPKEIDQIILSQGQKNVDINAIIFVSREKNENTLHKMLALQKKLKNCDQIKPDWYDKFADKEVIDQNINNLSQAISAIALDLPINKPSSVIDNGEAFKIIMVCKRDIKLLNDKENELVVDFLMNQKATKNAGQFLSNLRKKASVKIFLKI